MSEPNLFRELVVDTGVVVKFFVEEEDSDNADELLEDFLVGDLRLVALDFLFIEFANVMWVKTRLGELTEAEAEETISQLLELFPLMEIVPATQVLLEAFRNARKYELAAYDSALLALAESRAIQFVTADKKLYRKVRPRSSNALLLSNWQATP